MCLQNSFGYIGSVKYSVWKKPNIERKQMSPHCICHFIKTLFRLCIMLDTVQSTFHNAVCQIVKCTLFTLYFKSTVQCIIHGQSVLYTGTVLHALLKEKEKAFLFRENVKQNSHFYVLVQFIVLYNEQQTALTKVKIEISSF